MALLAFAAFYFLILIFSTPSTPLDYLSKALTTSSPTSVADPQSSSVQPSMDLSNVHAEEGEENDDDDDDDDDDERQSSVFVKGDGEEEISSSGDDDAPAAAVTPPSKGTTTTKRVPLEAHIMSKCPDARDCIRDMVVPAMERIADKVDFRLSFIGG